MDILFLHLFTKIIVVSNTINRQLKPFTVIQKKQIAVHNAINFDLFARDPVQSKNNKTIIGFVGRLSPEKGVDVLIQSCIDLKEKDIDFHLIIVGEGPEEAYLKKKVSTNNLHSNVDFEGFQDNVAPFLRIMDLFVLPSLTEGLPLALLEAMASGAAPIATEVGEIPNIITSHVNGILIPPNDSRRLTEALMELIGNRQLRFAIGRNASQYIERHFSIQKWICSMEKIYQSLTPAQGVGAQSRLRYP